MTTHIFYDIRFQKGTHVLFVDFTMPFSAHGGWRTVKSLLTDAASAAIGCLLALLVLFAARGAMPAAALLQDAGCCFSQTDSATKVEVGPQTAVMFDGFGNSNSDPDFMTIYWDGRYIRGPLSSRTRRKIRRTRADIQEERRKLLEKTNREIDEIALEFHEKLPREKAEGIGGLYARYSSRFQDSLADQIRTLFEAAYQLKIFIPREQIYFDMAIRGYQDRRPGLAALRKAIEEKQFNTFLVFATSRLFRRTYKALQFVEEQLVEKGIRAIFVKSGIDTADGDKWRTTFQLFAALDEAVVRMYGAHVRAAHEGLFIRRMVCTSLPLGYTGEEVPGEMTKRKRPRRRIIIDVETKSWIVRIFEWFGNDRLSLDEIARRLNDDPDAPAPAKSLTGMWSHALVRKHLMNPCYHGFWSYGAAETKWSSDKDYAQRVLRPAPLKSALFEDLRIISDELWHAVQKRLAEEVVKSGRKPRDGRKSLPNLLRALFFCPEHNRHLVVSGAHASIVFCPICRSIVAEKRPLFTHLNRALALRLTCEKLAELVRLDEELVNQIIVACQQEANAAQRSDPDDERQLRVKREKLKTTIEFNRRNPGDTEEEQKGTEKLLKQLRGDLAAIEAEISSIEAAKNRLVVVPTAEQVREMLVDLGDILTKAANSRTDAQLGQARRIIEILTGGRIELFQMGERKAQRGWLQGRFRVRLLSFLIERVTGVRPLGRDDGFEVVIDYREPPVSLATSEEAFRLCENEGWLKVRIAKKLGISKSRVTALLKDAYSRRGRQMPDGRSRRATLIQKHQVQPMFQTISDDAKVLWDDPQYLSMREIGRRLGCTDTTAWNAIVYWHSVRDLPLPTAEERRLRIMKRARQMYENNIKIKDIAATFGYSARGMKLSLKDEYARTGEPMPDGRSRRPGYWEGS